MHPRNRFPTFDVTNWYWFVAGDETQVYSSASNSYVPVDDPTYQAWFIENNGFTTNIDSEAELAEVVTLRGLPVPPAKS